MFVYIKYLISILLLIGIENVSSNQAFSLDGKHDNLVRLTRRRMSQEANLKSPVTDDAGCPGEICGVVSGKVIRARLAAAPNCARQDIADQLITDAKTNPLVKGDKLRGQLIQWAKLICESEQNTHPDYKKNPQTQRNFLYCLKAPKNKELDDCIPKQFEGNDPNVFFDPKVGSVALGSRPETFPRQKQNLYKGPKTTPTGTESDNTKADPSKMKVVEASNLPEKCNKPEIKYGAGFPGRPAKEMTYMPVQVDFYTHVPALNMHIVAEDMCNKMRACLKEANKADTEIHKRCKTFADAIGDKKKDGKAADTWNAGWTYHQVCRSQGSYLRAKRSSIHILA